MLSIYYHRKPILQTDCMCIVLRTAVPMTVSMLGGENIPWRFVTPVVSVRADCGYWDFCWQSGSEHPSSPHCCCFPLEGHGVFEQEGGAKVQKVNKSGDEVTRTGESSARLSILKSTAYTQCRLLQCGGGGVTAGFRGGRVFNEYKVVENWAIFAM